ncbi:hypothetical protein UlMin_036616 [Ulmus minor]
MAASDDGRGDKYRNHLNERGEKITQWRFGEPPNYDVVNKLFEEGRTKVWPAGSLEEKVQNLVKTWEMELVHKANVDDFIYSSPDFTYSLNGRKPLTREEMGKMGGSYNLHLQTSLPEHLRIYNPAEENMESSHRAFTTVFPRGFALEVLQVYTGPPVIVYKFRHWGYMEGPFKGRAATGELIEIFGMAIFEANEKMRVMKVEFFFDRGELLGKLVKGEKLETEAVSSCPILKNTG